MKYITIFLIYLVLFCTRLFFEYKANQKLKLLEGKKLYIEGRISSEPILQGINQRFRVVQFDILTNSETVFSYGERVGVVGTLTARPLNKWYSTFGLIYPSISVIKADKKMSLRGLIIAFRQKIELRLEKYLPEPESSLLKGVLLGQKTSLPRRFYEALKRSGTMHLVVASGYNVTLIINSAMAVFSNLLKRQKAVFLAGALVLVFCAMANFEPAIVRASLMAFLASLALILGRPASGLRLLFLTAALMLLIKPWYVLDIGWQLSFSATLGLLMFGRKLSRLGVLGETLAAQIFVWPLLWWHFNQFNAWGLATNCLVLPLVPLIMALGVILALTGWQISAWLAYVPLTIMVRVIEFFGRL